MFICLLSQRKLAARCVRLLSLLPGLYGLATSQYADKTFLVLLHVRPLTAAIAAYAFTLSMAVCLINLGPVEYGCCKLNFN